ncbi:hypothetical protein [Kordiimonas aestuarii]|uniref:hypothetical protein n=1 Tax=Kordiimonas aestuarii TaxID=1005925 RepID=UPI0021CEF8B4|nr:hypothetical protein [Kordiimonas aestuarii]
MNYRETLEAIRRILDARPDLAVRHDLAKQVVRAFRVPAFYEMSQRCNLWCEGCYYFENKDRNARQDEQKIESWQAFFEAEQLRNVSMAYFVGAEPALEQDRLRAAAGRIPYGKIGTNGTIPIDKDIPFRIGVSVWGDKETDTQLRGGSVLKKALRNYEGDPRAIMLFTLSPWNLHTVPEVLKMCRDHGIPLTFSIFSPTQTYMEKIQAHQAPDNRFYRVAASRGAPVFDDDGLKRLKDSFYWSLDNFADTVLFSEAYADWICKPGPLYQLDEEGVATNCASRIRRPLRYHNAQLESITPKCCTPDIDCSECRLYSGGWSSKFVPEAQYLTSPTAFERWLDMLEVLGRIFLYPLPEIYQSLNQREPVRETA